MNAFRLKPRVRWWGQISFLYATQKCKRRKALSIRRRRRWFWRSGWGLGQTKKEHSWDPQVNDVEHPKSCIVCRFLYQKTVPWTPRFVCLFYPTQVHIPLSAWNRFLLEVRIRVYWLYTRCPQKEAWSGSRDNGNRKQEKKIVLRLFSEMLRS